MINDPFLILPAIDLRDGKVVRLAQGDPARQTTYGDDPRAWAERWQADGASWLHVVNLDGAFGEDSSANLKTLECLLSLDLKIEFGGGVRDQPTIEGLLGMGVERVCLGTAAIREPQLVEWALQAYGQERIVADIGARDGQVMVKGWQEAASLTVLEAGRRFKEQGLEWCVLTNVRRDGTGQGIDLTAAKELQDATGLKVVASGGVSRLEEVQEAWRARLAGIIVGRALYEGKLSLRDCYKVKT